MVRQVRRIKIREYGVTKYQFNFVLGRVRGVLDVLSDYIPCTKREYPDILLMKDKDGYNCAYFECSVTDDQWAEIRNYLFSDPLYKQIIKVYDS